MMSHHDHVLLQGNELTAENLIGAKVYGPENEKVGTVGDLLLSSADEVRSAVIDVGGFLGLGSKPVAVPFDVLRFVRNGSDGTIHAHVAWTKAQLNDRPEFVRPERGGDFVFYAPPFV